MAINVREHIHKAALMSKLIVRYALCIMNYALTIVHYALKICSSVLLSFPTLSRIPIPHSSLGRVPMALPPRAAFQATPASASPRATSWVPHS